VAILSAIIIIWIKAKGSPIINELG
jgi:hypothetical protein